MQVKSNKVVGGMSSTLLFFQSGPFSWPSLALSGTIKLLIPSEVNLLTKSEPSGCNPFSMIAPAGSASVKPPTLELLGAYFICEASSRLHECNSMQTSQSAASQEAVLSPRPSHNAKPPQLAPQHHPGLGGKSEVRYYQEALSNVLNSEQSTSSQWLGCGTRSKGIGREGEVAKRFHKVSTSSFVEGWKEEVLETGIQGTLAGVPWGQGLWCKGLHPRNRCYTMPCQLTSLPVSVMTLQHKWPQLFKEGIGLTRYRDEGRHRLSSVSSSLLGPGEGHPLSASGATDAKPKPNGHQRATAGRRGLFYA